jgi:hypothetical protein
MFRRIALLAALALVPAAGVVVAAPHTPGKSTLVAPHGMHAPLILAPHGMHALIAPGPGLA